MDDRRILDIIDSERRARGLPAHDRNSKEAEALRRAAMRISQEALTDQRTAARTASMAGAIITRGRTRL
jgi:hypothetical protein